MKVATILPLAVMPLIIAVGCATSKAPVTSESVIRDRWLSIEVLQEENSQILKELYSVQGKALRSKSHSYSQQARDVEEIHEVMARSHRALAEQLSEFRKKHDLLRDGPL